MEQLFRKCLDGNVCYGEKSSKEDRTCCMERRSHFYMGDQRACHWVSRHWRRNVPSMFEEHQGGWCGRNREGKGWGRGKKSERSIWEMRHRDVKFLERMVENFPAMQKELVSQGQKQGWDFPPTDSSACKGSFQVAFSATISLEGVWSWLRGNNSRVVPTWTPCQEMRDGLGWHKVHKEEFAGPDSFWIKLSGGKQHSRHWWESSQSLMREFFKRFFRRNHNLRQLTNCTKMT